MRFFLNITMTEKCVFLWLMLGISYKSLIFELEDFSSEFWNNVKALDDFFTRLDCQSNAKPSEKDHDLPGIGDLWSSSQHTQPLHHLVVVNVIVIVIFYSNGLKIILNYLKGKVWYYVLGCILLDVQTLIKGGAQLKNRLH
jgi:hypothetical protein